MNKTIRVANKIGIIEVEKLIAELGNIENDEINFSINIKTKILGFGTLPLLVLLFFTWLRNKKGNLIIEYETKDFESAKQFGSTYLGYMLLLSAWKHRPIIDKNGNQIKTIFREQTQELHKRIDFLQNLPNESILIPLFDHYSKEKGLSHWFYTADFNLYNSPESLDTSIFRIFQELGKIYRTRFTKNNKSILDDLQVIIWELIGNTHHHATKDHLNKVDLSPNIRGLYLQIHRSTKKQFISNAVGDLGLQQYYENTLTEGDNFIIEISVFDSGPGIVKRFLGKEWKNNLMVEDEVSAIKNCLVKGVSSTTGANGMARGFGLNNVLHTLSQKKGFLKVRSGKVSLYRDLELTPHLDATEGSEIQLMDWRTQNSKDYNPMADMIGTTITMSYPLTSMP